jgi:hypothetical protein
VAAEEVPAAAVSALGSAVQASVPEAAASVPDSVAAVWASAFPQAAAEPANRCRRRRSFRRR